MTSKPIAVDCIQRATRGDLEAFSQLLTYPAGFPNADDARYPALVLSTGAVRQVLFALLQQRASPSLIRQWASFMRRGYLAGGRGGVRPLVIDYDPSAESTIVEILARLDEIGDAVDGELAPAEVEAMLAGLPA